VRVLVTGAGGLLGGVVCRTAPADVEVVWLVRSSAAPDGVEALPVDLAAPGASGRLREAGADAVIHCAYGMNHADIVDATGAVVDACAGIGVALVAVSSDMVFDGEHAPYAELDPQSPVVDYGRWKAEAERAVAGCAGAAVVRTSLLVHPDPPDHGMRWLSSMLGRGDRVTLFDDEIRCPVMAADLARALWEILALPPERRRGVWHVAGPEPMSRFDLGMLMVAHLGLDASLVDRAPQSTSPAVRPRDLTLSCERALAELRVRPRRVDAAALASPW
jgi:dTDP-4-dehydrorhamnose reductase